MHYKQSVRSPQQSQQPDLSAGASRSYSDIEQRPDTGRYDQLCRFIARIKLRINENMLGGLGLTKANYRLKRTSFMVPEMARRPVTEARRVRHEAP